MDGSHIDVDRHLPLRYYLINLGGCALTYGRDFGCRMFSEPILAVDDANFYLRPPDGASGETLIAGPLLAALRTVREVERLADSWLSCPPTGPSWPCWVARWPSGIYSGASIPATLLTPSSETGCNALWHACATRRGMVGRWRWRRTPPGPGPPRQLAPSDCCSASRATPTVTGSAPPAIPG